MQSGYITELKKVWFPKVKILPRNAHKFDLFAQIGIEISLIQSICVCIVYWQKTLCTALRQHHHVQCGLEPISSIMCLICQQPNNPQEMTISIQKPCTSVAPKGAQPCLAMNLVDGQPYQRTLAHASLRRLQDFDIIDLLVHSAIKHIWQSLNACFYHCDFQNIKRLAVCMKSHHN